MGRCLLCGWSENQFWLASFRAVYNLLTAEYNRFDFVRREQWEQTRRICDFIMAFSPNRRKGSSGPSFPLPWDNEKLEQEIEILTPEEIDKRFRERDEKVKKRFQNA